MRYYVEINGISSLTLTGFAIKELPPISKPPIRTQRDEIDGRDGDIITKLGYGAYDKQIEVGLYGNDYDINEIISFFNSEGIITFSNEPDKYYNFTIVNQIDFEKLLKFKTATITFHCQPFKYRKDEEPIEVEYQYVEGEGTEITLDNTDEQPIKMELYGNTSQEGTPTPDNPIPVNVVSGDNEIVVSGTNMLDISQLQTQTISGITITNNGDGSITMNGTSTSAITLDIPITHIPLSANKTYTFAKKQAIGSAAYAISLRKENTSYLETSSLDSGLVSLNITPTSNVSAYYMRIYIVNNRTLNNHTFFPLLKEGSTISGSDYVKFNGLETYNIDLPVENLWGGISYSHSFGGFAYTYNMDGTITVNGTSTGSGTSASAGDMANNGYYKVLKAGTYTISGAKEPFIVQAIKLVGTTPSILASANENAISASFTLTEDTNVYLRLDAPTTSSGTQVNNLTIKWQLEKGSKANPYTPFGTTPIEMCNIPDENIRDGFLHDKSLDKWYLHKEIIKIVFDGTEEWGLLGTRTSGKNRFKVTVSDNKLNTSTPTTMPIYCNKLVATSPDGTFLTTQGIAVDVASVGQILVYIEEVSTYNLTNFKTWLTTNNLEVHYILATPTNTEITYQPLIDQLNELEEAISNEGQTNISQVNNDLPFYIKATTRELGSDTATIINEGNIYSKPILNVIGEGNVGVSLNGNQIFNLDLSDPNAITIDPNKLEAYNPNSLNLMNRKVIGDIANLKLLEGTNELKFDGALTKATITNYSRWL